MNATPARKSAKSVAERLDALAAYTDEPGRLTRLTLGRAHRRAAEQVAQWMREAGMKTRIDAVGTVVGRYAANFDDAPVLLLGSHIDSVRDAGRFDGPVGVLAAIAVVERLQKSGQRLPFAIDVVAFGDEEGVRFPTTLTGSKALAGRFERRWLDEKDADGTTRRAALEAFGCDPLAIGAEARDPAGLLGYIELHIEQGPVLEAEGLPVGVVTAIAGATRGRVTVVGVAGHAGTVPMALRRDAMAAAAEMILAVEHIGKSTPNLVATVGTLDAPGGAVNVIPGTVSFSFDVRSPDDGERLIALGDIEGAIVGIAEKRGVKAEIRPFYEAPAAACDDHLSAALAAAVDRAGYAVRRLPSGAGHDGMSFKDRVPIAMLFVRCRGGISHNPAEYASDADIAIATHVLADCIDALAAEQS